MVSRYKTVSPRSTHDQARFPDFVRGRTKRENRSIYATISCRPVCVQIYISVRNYPDGPYESTWVEKVKKNIGTYSSNIYKDNVINIINLLQEMLKFTTFSLCVLRYNNIN